MQITPLEIISLIFTYLVFGAIGFRLANRFRRPIAVPTWLTVVGLTLASGFVMIGGVLIGIDGFKIHINTSLQALGIGILLGLAARELKLRIKSNPS